MKPVQIVMDEPLLREIDLAVRKAKTNRSALVREAVKEHLKRRRIRELEEKERAAYQRFPPVEFDVWDKLVSWPDD